MVSNSSGLFLHATSGWAADLETGTWSDLSFSAFEAGGNLTIIEPTSALIQAAGTEGGKAANLTDGVATLALIWTGTPGDKVLSLRYVYNGGKNAWKKLGVWVDGAAIEGVALIESTRGTDVYFDVPVKATLRQGARVEIRLLDVTGVEVFLEGVKVFDT